MHPKILSVVGTRPNFIKISPLVSAIKKRKEISHVLVHTGQHYDRAMSRLFFDELGIPNPDVNLGVGSASDVGQTARIMVKLEKILAKEKPDLIIVVGDVNSTLAAAITARKCGIKVAHAEAGLRSFDLTMPEETNRILTDHISDFLFTTEESGNRNLINEGIDKNKIFFVGNLMIDTLLKHREKARKSAILKRLGLVSGDYAVLTLHRPGNVDNKKSLKHMLSSIGQIQNKIKVVFPVHPRTLKNIRKFGLGHAIKILKNLIITEPLGYLDFLCLMGNSKFVMTDSGGIQEETTVLGIPCITLRNNTERPVTAEEGTNLLVSANKEKVVKKAMEIIKGVDVSGKIPKLWDGKAAERIADVITGSFKD